MFDLKPYLPEVKSGLALDVGTRFGEFAVRIARAMPEGSRVIAIDNVVDVVEQAKEKCKEPGVEFVCMDGAALEYADGSFELVAVSNTLHHMENYREVLSEMLRVLAPGGCFIVNEMYSDVISPAQKVHVAQHSFEAKLDMLTGVYQRETWKKEELLSILSELPLQDVTVSEFDEEPVFSEKLRQKNEKLDTAVEKKLAGRPEYEAMMAEAKEIQAMCARDGIERCTQLLYIGRKK